MALSLSFPSKRPARRPPGPKGLPVLGSLLDLGHDVLGFLSGCARRYGDMTGFTLAGWPAVLLAHPSLVEEVLVRHPENFAKHRFFWRHVTAIFGQGLLTSEGDFWLHQRRLAAPAFSGARLERYGEVMVRYAQAMLRDWQPGQSLDLQREAMGLTLKIVAKTLFDAETDDDVAEIHDRFGEVLEEIAVRFHRPFRIPDAVPLPGNLRYRRGVARIDRLVARILDERRRNPGDRGDLLSMLLAARDRQGQPMGARQIRDEAVTLLLAGHETTALTLSWAWHLLSLHPDADARLAEEVRRVLGGRPPTFADMQNLPFTEQVVTETMRLYPPAYAIGREAVADCEIGGYPIAAGTTVYLSAWVHHRDPRWFDEPLAFRPQRWDDDLAKRLPRFAFMPFGGGPRICIGNRFAMMEAMLILATVAQSFTFANEAKQPIVPSPSITLRPKGGVPARLIAR